MINGTVRYQNLKITTPLIASDTIDYLTAWFTFLTPDWAGCEVFAHFRQGEAEYDCRVINGQVTADQHINLGEGVWDVYLHGDVFRDGEVIKRITTEPEKITVVKSGILNGEPFPSVPGSVVEELLAKQLDPADKTFAMTQPVGRDAAGKLWTEPTGGGGGGAGTWDTLTGKPFASIGDTLAVSDEGVLDVNIHEVSNDAGGLTTVIG